MTDQERSLALDEWKETQATIRHQEKIIYNIRGWAITLFTALSVLVLKNNPKFISSYDYFFLGFVVVLLFYSLEIYLRVPLHRVIQRARQIETAIRDEQPYGGLQLSGSFVKGSDFEDIKKLCKRGRVLAPYLLLLGVLILTTIIVVNKQ